MSTTTSKGTTAKKVVRKSSTKAAPAEGPALNNLSQEARAESQAVSLALAESLVPSPEWADTYISRDLGGYEDQSVFDFARQAGINVFLHGPTGAAKTHAIYAYAATHGLPVANVSCHVGADPRKWYGKWTPQPDRTLRWRDGMVTSVVRNAPHFGGAVVLYDEINMTRPDIAASLYTQLDDRRMLILEERDDEVIHIPEGVLLTAAANLGYGGTRPLNHALRNRFRLQFQWDYEPEIEAEMVTSPALLQWAEDARQHGVLETPIPTSALVDFETYARSLDIDFAKEQFLSRFSDTERVAVDETLGLVLDAIAKDLADNGSDA